MTTTKEKKPAPKKKKRSFSVRKLLIGSLGVAVLAVVMAFCGYLFLIAQGQKELIKGADKFNMDEAAQVFDVNGNEVTTLSRVNREIVEYKEIPQKLINAFIATEDRRFNEHAGVDLYSLGRAVVKDIVNRSTVEGGSTITQQLAKNMFLNADKTFFRKATEVSIAIALEREHTKDEIITLYLNRIYFGNGAYGIKAAAKVYFGVSDLSKLETWQMATLAGIPKAPSTYNPKDNPDKSKERRAVVLKLMADQGYITDAEKTSGQAIDYTAPQVAGKKQYLTFLDYVTQEATSAYGIEEDKLLREGYKIYTTMDANAQQIMEQTYDKPESFQKDGPSQKIQSSMVIINNKDGGIVAMIGGRDYVQKGLNRATVPRQPGSSFKPLIVYAPAIETGKYNPNSLLKDEETNFNGYTPHNYDYTYRGTVTMTEAVKKSINLPAVWLLNEIKLKTGKQFAENMGIKFEPEDNNLAIALGGMTKGASPLQMASAYSAFPNNGTQYKSHSIVKIVKPDGTEVDFKPDKPKTVMSAKTAYYMTQMMQTVVESGGTGTRAKFNRPIAGKTGSTQLDIKGLEKYYRDVWFVGYTAQWTAAVWEGFDKTDNKHYVQDSSGATAALFKEIMSKAMAKMPVVDFVKPNNVPSLDELPSGPAAVTGLKAEYVPANRMVQLSWTSAGDNAVYRVYRKASKDADFAKLLELKTANLNDISVVPGETYTYYVKVYDASVDTEGDASEKVDVTVPAASGSPSPTPSPGSSGGSSSPTPGGSGTPKPGGSPVPSGSPGATPSPTPGGSQSTSGAPPAGNAKVNGETASGKPVSGSTQSPGKSEGQNGR